MMTRNPTGWIGSVVLCAVLAQGEPSLKGVSGVQTLEDCIRIGLSRSPRAMNARRDEQIARAQVIQARSLAMPRLTLSAEYRRLDELQEIELGDEAIELGTLDNYSVLGEVRQTLYSGGKVGAALRAAGLAREYAADMRLDTERALVRDIKTGFYDVLLAKEAVVVYRDSVKQLEALVEQTRQRFEKDAAAEFDVLQAQVKLANEKPLLIRARNTRAVAMEAFKNLLDLGEVEGFELEGQLTYEPVAVERKFCERLALANRPLLRAAGAGVSLREQDVTAARSQALPALSAFGTYNGANSYTFVSFEDEWEWHWNAGLALTWNLWDGGLTRGTVMEKKLELEKSRTDLADLRRAIILEIAQAVLDLDHAREAVEAGKGNIRLANKVLEIAQARHRAGLATTLDVTEANVAVSRARLTHVSALRDHQAALARLEYALGVERSELRKGDRK